MLKDFRFFFCRLILRRAAAVWFPSFLDLFSPAQDCQSGFFHHASDFEEVRILQRNSDLVSLFVFFIFGDSEEIANLWAFRLVFGPVEGDGLGISIAAGFRWVPVPGREISIRTRNKVFSPLSESGCRGCNLQGSVKVEAGGELLFPL
jgi:hypothetical protein